MKKLFSLIIICLSIIYCEKILAYNEYKIGDIINYHGVNYYVIENSDSDTNYLVLLKAFPFTQEELKTYRENDAVDIQYVDKFYGIQYYNSDSCNSDDNKDGCSNEYSDSNVKSMLDNWEKSSFSDNDLVLVDGYKVRLITVDELLNNLGYNSDELVTEKVYKLTTEVPDWVYKYYQYGEYSYWTMSDIDDSNYAVSVVLKSGDVSALASYYTLDWNNDVIKENMVYKYRPIRPVINLNKSVIENNIEDNNDINKDNSCIVKYRKEKIIKYNTYSVGDEIEYKGTKFIVINNSDDKKNYITLLKDDTLTNEQISEYTNNEYSDHKVPFYTSDTCNFTNKTGCKSDYDSSLVKKIIDNWVDNELDSSDLVSVNGYKSRLVNLDDLIYHLGFEMIHGNTGAFVQNSQSVNYLKPIDYMHQYWTMVQVEDDNYEISTVDYYFNKILGMQLYYNFSIRPVINLNKCVVDDGCYEEEINVFDGCVEEIEDDNNIIESDKDGEIKNNSNVANPKTFDNINMYLVVLFECIMIIVIIFGKVINKKSIELK